MVRQKQARTLPQQVASIMAQYKPVSDYDLLRAVVERYYNVTFERKPNNTGEVISVIQHLPNVDQIGRARRNAEKSGSIAEWVEFYESPTREAERIRQEFSNTPHEYQKLDERDEL